MKETPCAFLFFCEVFAFQAKVKYWLRQSEVETCVSVKFAPLGQVIEIFSQLFRKAKKLHLCVAHTSLCNNFTIHEAKKLHFLVRFARCSCADKKSIIAWVFCSVFGCSCGFSSDTGGSGVSFFSPVFISDCKNWNIPSGSKAKNSSFWKKSRKKSEKQCVFICVAF